MKAKRFIYIALAVVASCGFATNCSDDEPEDPRINDPYNSSQFIFIDNESIDKSQMTGGGQPLLFDKEGFYKYSTILTYSDNNYTYEVFIPASGGELNLSDASGYNWFKTQEFTLVNGNNVALEEENLGVEEGGNSGWYYFRKYNDYLSISHTVPEQLDFKIEPNTSKDERRISVRIYEDAPVSVFVEMIFIQQGKK